MARIPRDDSFDSTLAMLREGYLFIGNRCRSLETDVFATRLLLKKAICFYGAEAAELICDESRFMRQGAQPARLQKTLLGKRGVQTLDDAEHRHRKALFMSVLNEAAVERLVERAASEFRAAARRWQARDEVQLFAEVEQALCRAVCGWAGVPVRESEVPGRARDFEAMIDASGGVGPRHARGRDARRRAETWLVDVVAELRRTSGAKETPAGAFAEHRDLRGRRLKPRVAAVEILNLLRPTVAVSRFILFEVLAMHEHPGVRERLAEGDPRYVQHFVQEVRRFYPFFPFIGARVRRDFEWRGFRFPRGRRVFLDLYGTDHDARIWQNPGEFRPERFEDWDGSAFTFIPQGPGDHWQNHRCAGEVLTRALMEWCARFFATELSYTVPPQDLRVSLRRIPALPESRLLIRDVALGRERAAAEHVAKYA